MSRWCYGGGRANEVMTDCKMDRGHLLKLPLPTMLCITMAVVTCAAAGILQNPNFQNTTGNRTNSIPGWSSSGAVHYVTSGNNYAIQLGENGRINQTVRVATNEVFDYVLSFNLGAINGGCATGHRTSVNVTVREEYRYSNFEDVRWQVFYFDPSFSRNFWQANGFYLGRMVADDAIVVHLEIKSSVPFNSRGNVTSCGPLVDDFTVKRNELRRWVNGNLLSNGDFEVGPSLTNTSSDGGILLKEQLEVFNPPLQEWALNSPLQEWLILGTIKYIDSRHYKVPHGKSAIQLLSGSPSGVQVERNPPLTTSTYTLNFTIGDANDSCIGDFTLFLKIGSDVRRFVMASNGTGSAYRHSIVFGGDPSKKTTITLYTLNETRTVDGILCGPVLDDISLFASRGGKLVKLRHGIPMFSFFIALGFLTL